MLGQLQDSKKAGPWFKKSKLAHHYLVFIATDLWATF